MRIIILLIIIFNILVDTNAQINNISKQFDVLGRIKQEIYADSMIVTYQYDATGNRISRTVSCLISVQTVRRDTICEGETFAIGQNGYIATGIYKDTFRRTIPLSI